MDPVEAFMEACSTLPGHVSRMLVLMRELDEQNHTLTNSLDACRQEAMKMLQSGQCGSPPSSIEKSLEDIQYLGKQSKSCMREKIALSNQLLHMVRYERERLSHDYQKLMREAETHEDRGSKDKSAMKKLKSGVPVPTHHRPTGDYPALSPTGSSINAGGRSYEHLSEPFPTAGHSRRVSTLPTDTSPLPYVPQDARPSGGGMRRLLDVSIAHPKEGSIYSLNEGWKGGSSHLVTGGDASLPPPSVNTHIYYKKDTHDSDTASEERKAHKSVPTAASSDTSSVSLHERTTKRLRKDKSNGSVSAGIPMLPLLTSSNQPIYTEKEGSLGPSREDLASPRAMRISMASSRQGDRKIQQSQPHSPSWKPPGKILETVRQEEVGVRPDHAVKLEPNRITWSESSFTHSEERAPPAAAEEDLWDGTCPICQKGESETQHMMVGCDACNNWFHFECVNYNGTGSEDAAWFCPQCIEARIVPQSAGMADAKAARPRRR